LLTNHKTITAMKKNIVKIIGFALGLVGFLLVFKVFVLPTIPPNDEMAPGVVVIVAILNGFLFAFIGSLIQKYLKKNQV
jgi:hypothetical protein